MPVELTERQRRLLDAVLALAVVALAFVVVGDVAGVLSYFLDILFLFFLAWLLAFAILPLIHLVKRLVPGIPDLAAVIMVYLAIVGLLLGVIIQASASLATSIGQFIQDAPRLEDELGSILTDLQHRLARPRLPGGPRQPGAHDRARPPELGDAAGWARSSRSRSPASACWATCCWS